MACFSPLDAWQLVTGEIVFSANRKGSPRPDRGIRRELTLPCGQCVGCRLERSRQWAVRCMHEAQMHENNCFVTLTYKDAALPEDFGLRYSDFQRFMRDFRRAHGKVRFYMCGEYGEQLLRPHYHAAIFGFDFPDRVYFRTTPSGSKLYTSKLLEDLWPHGHSSVGDVTFESAAYIARYVMKKANGKLAETRYQRVDSETGEMWQVPPEFTRMSLKPGIGSTWLEKYKADVYPADHVLVNGKFCKPPRYYDKQLETLDYQTYEFIELGRVKRARASACDNTRDRLKTRELVTRARLNFKKRNLD
ncbi:replication initiator protein [Apis mellifera associated microvirus 15]|nr:replication initiator protein [Apis mellifera associated microvirus 15]